MEHEVAISVRDTGIGIAPERLSEIFEMFTQIASPMEGARGLGIGLTLARSLMEMHGGSIEVTSEGENRGSEFTLHLPLPPPETDLATGAGAGAHPALTPLDAPDPPGEVTEK